MNDTNKKVLKGMIVSVYSNKAYRQCANGGISEFNDELLLIGDDIPQIFEADDRPIVALKTKPNFNREGFYQYVEPLEPVPTNKTGYMFGGSFIYSSDSRITPTPLKIHDRTED